jgi:hypothetical protein
MEKRVINLPKLIKLVKIVAVLVMTPPKKIDLKDRAAVLKIEQKNMHLKARLER